MKRISQEFLASVRAFATLQFNMNKEVQFDCENSHAVYVLYKDKKAIYVGRSGQVFTRLGSHYRKSFDSVKLIWCSREDARMIESKLISELCPTQNKTTQRIFLSTLDGSVDWSELRDVEIAKIAGVSRERVRQETFHPMRRAARTNETRPTTT